VVVLPIRASLYLATAEPDASVDRPLSPETCSRDIQRVRAGGGDQPLRHPVVGVAEAVEAPSLVLDDVEEGAPV
jgi:hypothetical protein